MTFPSSRMSVWIVGVFLLVSITFGLYLITYSSVFLKLPAINLYSYFIDLMEVLKCELVERKAFFPSFSPILQNPQ